MYLAYLTRKWLRVRLENRTATINFEIFNRKRSNAYYLNVPVVTGKSRNQKILTATQDVRLTEQATAGHHWQHIKKNLRRQITQACDVFGWNMNRMPSEGWAAQTRMPSTSSLTQHIKGNKQRTENIPTLLYFVGVKSSRLIASSHFFRVSSSFGKPKTCLFGPVL